MKVISRHWFRRRAREREREIQAALDQAQFSSGPTSMAHARALLESMDVPKWARGVRVERESRRLGRWQVVATEKKGH